MPGESCKLPGFCASGSAICTEYIYKEADIWGGAIYNALNSNVAEESKPSGIIQAKPKATLCMCFRSFSSRSLTSPNKLGSCHATSRARFSKGDSRPRGSSLKLSDSTGYGIRPNMPGGKCRGPLHCSHTYTRLPLEPAPRADSVILCGSTLPDWRR